jgi:hypothetical protein
LPSSDGDSESDVEPVRAEASRTVVVELQESSISRFLILPAVVEAAPCRNHEPPLIDYSKSIVLTSVEYARLQEQKAAMKKLALQDRERKQREAKAAKIQKAQEKTERAAAKLQREKDREAKKAFDLQWSAATVREVGDRLHAAIKVAGPLIHADIARGWTASHPICKQNRQATLERLRGRRSGQSIPTASMVEPP